MHFIPCEGESTLITINGKTLLIDSGKYDDAVIYLRDMGIEYIDYFIITHFDTDNIGGVQSILTYFDIGTIIMPYIDEADMAISTRRIINEVKQADAELIYIDETNVNSSFTLDSAEFTVLTPLVIKYPDEYDCYSIAVRLVYGETSFMFMSDTTSENIEKLLENGIDLSADVIKIGSFDRIRYMSDELLSAVQPTHAVITKENNSLPEHEEFLQKLQTFGIETLFVGTDNAVIFRSDGRNVCCDIG